MLESGQELGGALGMAILGSVGAAVYSRDMAEALPACVPHADAVRETLGGATSVAARLPATTADAVLSAADFAERGFAGAKVDVIAERAGLTRGAVYSNFPPQAGAVLRRTGR